MRLHEEIGPQFGFNPQCCIRSPPVEEARHRSRSVEGDVLVDRAGWLPRRQSRGSRGRHGGEQNACAMGTGQPLRKGQHGERLADTGGVDPQERPLRPRNRASPEPFFPAQRVLLAAPEAPLDEERSKRFEEGGGVAVKSLDHGTLAEPSTPSSSTGCRRDNWA